MSLDYYRELFHMAVCDMAISSDKFSEKLRATWINYLYKVDWKELESLLMEEDLPLLQEVRRRLHDDLHKDIDKKLAEVLAATASAPRPLSAEQASKYANADTVLRSMNGVRASNCVKVIVKLYCAIDQTMEWRRV
ncbi:hypothetical protein HT745_16680 [Pseudosulfitobacter pseudonitzschiae]|uniref:hypothetical protein n=1 Tax=Pseudosulfitobacter pseudonitzschiae TaxID=1402135 RepID=UPI001583B2DD|nr:hypothetical protein [Pseudosulfitobacter pseudonitzschiae]QKS10009.1 hypothetical protein HT745_16680 [Pseudosulfitobacter pseudonitzschiae]